VRRRTLALGALVLLALGGWWLGLLIGTRSDGEPGQDARRTSAQAPADAVSAASVGNGQRLPAGWLDQIPLTMTGSSAVIQPGTPAWIRAIGPAPRQMRPSASTAWAVMSRLTFDGPEDLEAFRELSAQGSQRPGEGFRVENGRLRIDLAQAFKALAMPMDESGDIRLTFDLEVDPGQEAGDMTVFWGAHAPFHRDNPMSIAWNGYEAKLGAMGRTDHAFKRQGRETLERSASDQLQKPGSHAVQIEQNGNELQMWIDGRRVLTTVDGDPLDARPGAQVGILGQRMTGWIDNWTVLRPVARAPN
jgi:hypothetical protein